MNLPENVILLDSLGDIQPNNSKPILVCASHCGDNGTFANKLTANNIKAVFLNDAGVGKNQAGISGLSHYESAGIIACAVDCNSAEIGIAADTWKSGVISHLNPKAISFGICIGETTKSAVAKLNSLKANYGFTDYVNSLTTKKECTGEAEPTKQMQLNIDGVKITVTNSITFLNESNAGNIVVCGSHGGLSAGHYAQKLELKAVFFNDAGIGKNNAGIKSLESLSKAGILACTVDCMSAEIFNGQDALENGIISVCNQLALAKNININMTVKEAIKLI